MDPPKSSKPKQRLAMILLVGLFVAMGGIGICLVSRSSRSVALIQVRPRVLDDFKTLAKRDTGWLEGASFSPLQGTDLWTVKFPIQFTSNQEIERKRGRVLERLQKWGSVCEMKNWKPSPNDFWGGCGGGPIMVHEEPSIEWVTWRLGYW
jgi:hypothetical protein